MLARRAPGFGDIRDRSAATLWACAFLPPSVEMCRVPSQDEILSSDTNAGGQLTPENRQRATDLAKAAVNADCNAHPERYNMIPGSCSYDPGAADTQQWLLFFALFLAGFSGLLIWRQGKR